MSEVARMKLTQDNMRAMCDWVVNDRTITSHRLETTDGRLQINIDTPQGLMIIKHDQWLIKDDKGVFTVND